MEVFLIFESICCCWSGMISNGIAVALAETHSDILGSGLDQTAAARDKHRFSVHFIVGFVPQPVFISLYL